MARELAGGGKLDAAIEIDGDAIWKKEDLPKDTRVRLFPEERAGWVSEVVPALRARLEAYRKDALAGMPGRIRELCEASGFVLAPTAPGVPENTLLTGEEARGVLDGLTKQARARKAEMYAHAALRAQALAADDAARRRREAEERAWLSERQRRMDAASRDLAVQWATEARAAGTVQSQSLQDQMRSGTVVVPRWATQSRQSMQGFLDVVNEATVGR
jgi:hypothetical protein